MGATIPYPQLRIASGPPTNPRAILNLYFFKIGYIKIGITATTIAKVNSKGVPITPWFWFIEISDGLSDVSRSIPATIAMMNNIPKIIAIFLFKSFFTTVSLQPDFSKDRYIQHFQRHKLLHVFSFCYHAVQL